ncbi:hypothetical protein [Hydrogenophaga sp.]|uniref:hypothetical protein n=1 Tax=Hydrogenophaga sp. TaxID=1904254 RepID=UPI00261CCB24|nr:hypothetical protein [Hydrogenophaga sp.]MCW5655502.1 hypothetical protein [Hydrogenophaga sp.]
MRWGTLGRRAWLCALLIVVAPLGWAAGAQANRADELLDWVRQTYESTKRRIADGREREAQAWLMQEKEKAEVEAIKACANAVDLRAQIACIERRSNAFTDKYSKRAKPEELRFAVLAELQGRLARTKQPTGDNGMGLVQRVTARCSSGQVPREEQAKCLQHAQDCVRIGASDRAASTQCLQALDALIASAGSASSNQRQPKGGECAIFDDPAKSDALAQRDPDRHFKLLTECMSK